MVRMRCPRWYMETVECPFCKYVAKHEYQSTWMQLPDKSEEAWNICNRKLKHHFDNHHTCWWCGMQPRMIKGWHKALTEHQDNCQKNPIKIQAKQEKQEKRRQEKQEKRRNTEAFRFLAVKAELPEDILKLIDGELHPHAAAGSM